MKIKILSTNKKLFEGEAESITLPGEEGEFQVLENHASLFSLLGRGEIIIGKNKRIPISSGIIEVLDNKILVLC